MITRGTPMTQETSICCFMVVDHAQLQGKNMIDTVDTCDIHYIPLYPTNSH